MIFIDYTEDANIIDIIDICITNKHKQKWQAKYLKNLK